MCGRYTLSASPARLREHFRLLELPRVAPRYNIAPSQAVPAVRETGHGRELVLLRWGLIPSWARDEKSGYSMINARAETVAVKPSFRQALRQRRCLILADGFYEWRAVAGAKQPYHIALADGEPFAFAGIWERWEERREGTDARVIESCSIIVTQANDRVRPIHERMPVIVHPGDYDLWLDPAQRDPARLAPVLCAYPAERMVVRAVSRRVNNARNDDPECITPVSE